MAGDTKMTITKEAVTSLDARAVAKFAKPGTPGRVLNIDCETTGTGTATIQMVHPDGSIQSLVSVTVPLLAKGESCVLRARIDVGIRGAKAEVVGVARESK